MLAVQPIGEWACDDALPALPDSGYFEIAFGPNEATSGQGGPDSAFRGGRAIEIGQLTEEIGRMFELGGEDGWQPHDDIAPFL
jgi:hypothetical protein